MQKKKRLAVMLAGLGFLGALPLEAKQRTHHLSRISFYKAGPKHDLAPSACGETIGPWQQVAVSRDLAAILPCGSLVTIVLDRPVGGRKTVTAVVWDVMSNRFENSVDILVGHKEKARVYGVATGRLKIQDEPQQVAENP
jgi:3D (Asp-Asp-Asp) domain-containing protein